MESYFVIGDNWRISCQGIVYSRIRHQVGLKLVEVHVQSSVKSQGSRDTRDDLSNQTVQIGVSGPGNIQFGAADIVNGLVVHQESAVTVLQSGVRV